MTMKLGEFIGQMNTFASNMGVDASDKKTQHFADMCMHAICCELAQSLPGEIELKAEHVITAPIAQSALERFDLYKRQRQACVAIYQLLDEREKMTFDELIDLIYQCHYDSRLLAERVRQRSYMCDVAPDSKLSPLIQMLLKGTANNGELTDVLEQIVAQNGGGDASYHDGASVKSLETEFRQLLQCCTDAVPSSGSE